MLPRFRTLQTSKWNLACKVLYQQSLHFSPKCALDCSAQVHFRLPVTTNFKLTSKSVERILYQCSSDLIALNFFLWCARQPNYFHDHQGFYCIVPVVGRLTEKYGSVRRVVREVENFGCLMKAQIFLVLLRIYWCGGMYNSALDTFDEMSNFGYTPNTFARNVLNDVLFKKNSADLAVQNLRDSIS